jgi:hypothetical protein
MDTDYVFVTGTELQVVAPPEPLTVGELEVAFSVRTVAGQSPPRDVTYAGVPVVSRVTNTTDNIRLNGTSGAADTGGTPITISGRGFTGQLIAPVKFVGSTSSFSLGTQYTFTVDSSTALSTETVGQNPARVNVRVCTATACSKDRPSDLLYLYPPGRPVVTSITPTSGRAAGGTKVTINGDNLGCAVGVLFGKVKAKFTPVPALLGCGSTITLAATSPPGRNGTAVPVSLITLQSYFTRSHGSTRATFTYG